MNAGARESQHVPVDVLPPIPQDAYSQVPTTAISEPPVPFAGFRTFYHPASGVVILGIDVLIFGTEVVLDMLTGFLALPFICAFTFLITFIPVYVIQLKWSKDSVGSAMGKAFLGAFLAAVPYPITGTLLGAAILALAGLPSHPKEMLQKALSREPSRK